MINLFKILLLLSISSQAMTLKEAYDRAGSNGDHDKLIRLEKGKIYTGGLYIGKYFNHYLSSFSDYESKNVKISGNGAIIDLQGSQISIGYCENVLDIDSCVIINGNVRFHGYSLDGRSYRPTGSVKKVTFYNNDDYCIRMEQAGDNIVIDSNLFVDCKATDCDFEQYTGTPMPKIETGIFVAGSLFPWDGIPQVTNNWSYYSSGDSTILRHYGFL